MCRSAPGETRTGAPEYERSPASAARQHSRGRMAARYWRRCSRSARYLVVTVSRIVLIES